MNTRLPALTLAGVLAAAALGGGLATALHDTSDTRSAAPAHVEPVADPMAAARTTFPNLEHASGEPTLPGLRDARPAPGTVATVPGPFDDRFRLSHLEMAPGAVTGSLAVTSDVSDLLELQVLAGFYDADGRLLGTARFTHHLVEGGHDHAGPPREKEQFRIRIPGRLRHNAVAAAIGVPVLVNE